MVTMPPVPLPRYEDHRAHLAAMRRAALAAVDPGLAVRRYLAPADWAAAKHIYLVGAGKAGVPMAAAVAHLLGERLTAGLVVVPHKPDIAPPTPTAQYSGPATPTPGLDHPRLTFLEGGHPHPTQGSLDAGRAIAALLEAAQPGDLVIAVISGGGSALLELPYPGIALEDLQAANDVLLKSGAAIHEINQIRARLSRIKGGGLARLAAPARVLGLILSDVVGNHLNSVASGPTVPSGSDPSAALKVVEQYQLGSQLPPAVMTRLTQPATGGLGALPVVENRLVGSNKQAGEAAAGEALALGFEARWLADDWQGEAREMGRAFAALLTGPHGGLPQTRLATGRLPPLPGEAPRPRCIVVGGETTVTVRGKGRGGRNQEAALAAALTLAGLPAVVVATLATDGVDGPTDAAGAIVTGETISRAGSLGLSAPTYLDDNNAYAFLAGVGALLRTGPTGTNVNDLWMGLVY